MPANPDFKEMFAALSDAKAEYIVIGAHAVMFYAAPRYTKDIDIWVRPTPGNADKVYQAIKTFGAPMSDLTTEDPYTEGTIFQIGVEPNRKIFSPQSMEFHLNPPGIRALEVRTTVLKFSYSAKTN